MRLLPRHQLNGYAYALRQVREVIRQVAENFQLDARGNAGQIQMASFINNAGLDSRGENLYKETSASGTPNTGTPGLGGLGLLQQGYVETSNVNVTEELINMIQAQRAFEINSRSIQASDQMLQKLSQL